MTKKLIHETVYNRYKSVNLELLDNYVDNKTKLKTKCYCGNIFYSKPSKIFNNHTKSCGCFRRSFQDIKLKNLVNKKFDKLLVISRSYFKRNKKNNRKYKYWNCLCDCGNYCVINQSSLGISSKSCGCITKQKSYIADIKIKIGDKFNKLTVVDFNFNYNAVAGKKRSYKCICECGKYTNVLQHSLFYNLTKSCGNCNNYIRGSKVSFIQLDLYKMINKGVINFRSGKYSIDIALLLNNKKIAIEYDSYLYHKNRLEKDKIRTNDLIKRGWSVLSIKSNSKLPKLEQLLNAINIISQHNITYHELILTDWGIK